MVYPKGNFLLRYTPPQALLKVTPNPLSLVKVSIVGLPGLEPRFWEFSWLT